MKFNYYRLIQLVVSFRRKRNVQNHEYNYYRLIQLVVFLEEVKKIFKTFLPFC